MNYLGHAVLSFGDGAVLTGNLIGDHVKGKLALEQFPEDIRRGILLHRRIDEFTDLHPASQRAKIFFRGDYGLYSGAVVDSLYDHFLANDPRHFSSEEHLLNFANNTYDLVSAHEEFFPEPFRNYFPYMRSQNWLYHYRTLAGMKKSLAGLHRRAKHMPDVEKAYHIFIGHYHQLAQCYYELMDDAVRFVKVQLSH